MAKTKYIFIGLLIALLVSVRAFESAMFYDPFLEYFKSDYSNVPLPDIDTGLWLTSTALRYMLNSGISILIIHIAFGKRDITTFSVILYGLFLIVALPTLCVAYGFFPEQKMALFYLRRFLIQPLLLLLFLPGFYFQLKLSRTQ